MEDNLKDALYDDEKFAEYRSERDDIDVVLDLTEFRWVLTDQLKAGTRADDETWVKSITGLIIRTKSRTAEVKRAVRKAGQGEEMDDALFDLRQDRAEDDL